MSQPACSTRIVLFDVWRIVAVALVVGVHLLQRVGHPWGRMFGIEGFYQVTLGGVGVTILLVLSGAVLAYTYSGREMGWTTFVTRRLAHIYPMYWISLVFAVAVFGRRVPEPLTGLQWAADLTGILAAFGHVWGGLLLPTSWFLAVIIPLYALYPLLARAMRTHPHLTLAIALAISVVARLFAAQYLPGTRGTDWFFPARLFEFAAGMWLLGRAPVLAFLRASGAGLPKPITSFIGWAAALSFPVYLIHWVIERWGVIDGLPRIQFLLVYFVVTVATAQVIHTLASVVERAARSRIGGTRPAGGATSGESRVS